MVGGAERLVVDAAVAMQSKGHYVAMYTSHHDPKHCFEETRNGMSISTRGTMHQLNIIVRRNVTSACLWRFPTTYYLGSFLYRLCHPTPTCPCHDASLS